MELQLWVFFVTQLLEDVIFLWQDMKEGLKNTLQWLTTAFLATINSTFSPTLSDSACSQARGNRNIFLLSHTPSSPWQQMGKYYKFFFFCK